MKTRELKAFLKNKGVQVDDCFDMDSSPSCNTSRNAAKTLEMEKHALARLIQRAAATEEDWTDAKAQRHRNAPYANIYIYI